MIPNSNFNFDLQRFATVGTDTISNIKTGETFTFDGTTYTAIEGGVAKSDGTTYTIYTGITDGSIATSELSKTYTDTGVITLSGITSLDAVSISGSTVTIGAASLKEESVLLGGDIENYTLALGSDVDTPTAPTVDPTTIPSTVNTYTISADGVYQFADGFTGTVTINATNVKLIGASSTLNNVSIDASAVSGINLWIQDLNISSTELKNLIRFGSGTNTLTVKGTNTLTDSASSMNYTQAVINVGTGTLNIIGDGSLTVQQTGQYSSGAAIGSDVETTGGAINIAGSVTVNATANTGAGIGSGYNSSIGAITIGGTANITANGFSGIGSGFDGSAGTITYGAGTTVNASTSSHPVQSETALLTDLTSTDPGVVYEWTGVENNTAACYQLLTTAGYKLDDNKTTITYEDDRYTHLFTLSGVKSIDGITVEGNTVTITAANLNNADFSIIVGDYTLALADDVTAPTTTAAHFDGLTYKSASSTEGYELVDGVIKYTAAVDATDLFTLTGVSSTDGIEIGADGVVTITADNLDESNVTISGGDYKLALADDVSPPYDEAAYFDGNTYKSASKTAGYELVDGVITYVAAVEPTDLFTLKGVVSTDGISVEGNTVTITAANFPTEPVMNPSIIISGEGYTLAIADDVTTSTTTAAHFDGNTYKSESKTAGYELSSDGKSISYAAASKASNLFELIGVANTDGITVDNGVVTITAANLNEEDVAIIPLESYDYTLALASDVSAPSTTAAHFDGNVYKSEATTAGYSLVDGAEIVYTTETAETNLFELIGVANTDGITVDNGTVTITAANLNEEDVAIIPLESYDYTLALASDVSAPSTTAAHFDGNVYKSASSTAGYALVDGVIEYTAAVDATDLFTLTGVSSTDGITVNNGTVTITAANLNGASVSIDGAGYSLALASDVSAPSTTAAHFDGNVYKSEATTAGYALVDGVIEYTAAVDATDLFTLTGVANTDGITVDNGVVTITAANLNGANISIEGAGYSLALASDVSAPSTTAAHFDGNVYKSEATTAGYELVDGVIEYTAAVDATDLFTLTGVSSTDGIVVGADGTVTITAANLNGANISIEGDGYTLALADDIEAPQTVAAHFAAIVDGTSTYLSSSTSAGYETAADGKSVAYIAAVDAVDGFIIRGITDTVGIGVDDGTFINFSGNFTDNVANIHVTGIDFDTPYTLNGAQNAWLDIDGNSSDVELNLWTAIDDGFAFNNQISITGVNSYDNIKVVDGGLNFLDAAVADDYNVHVNGTTAVSVNGSARNLIDGDFDDANGLEFAHTPQTLASITFDGANYIFSDGTHSIAPSDDDEMFGFETTAGGLVLGSTNNGVAVNVESGTLTLYDGGAVAGKLNAGDGWQNGSIVVDANDHDAWVVDGDAIVLSTGADGLRLGGLTATSALTLITDGSTLTINGATDISGLTINGESVSGAASNAGGADGYVIANVDGIWTYADDTTADDTTVEDTTADDTTADDTTADDTTVDDTTADDTTVDDTTADDTTVDDTTADDTTADDTTVDDTTADDTTVDDTTADDTTVDDTTADDTTADDTTADDTTADDTTVDDTTADDTTADDTTADDSTVDDTTVDDTTADDTTVDDTTVDDTTVDDTTVDDTTVDDTTVDDTTVDDTTVDDTTVDDTTVDDTTADDTTVDDTTVDDTTADDSTVDDTTADDTTVDDTTVDDTTADDTTADDTTVDDTTADDTTADDTTVDDTTVDDTSAADDDTTVFTDITVETETVTGDDGTVIKVVDTSVIVDNSAFVLGDDADDGSTTVCDLSQTDASVSIELGSGNQEVQLSDKGGSRISIGSTTTGTKTVRLGNGGDVVTVDASGGARVNLLCGKGMDIVRISNGAVNIDVSAGGATSIYPSGGTINLSGYNADSGAGFVTASNNVVDDIRKGNIAFSSRSLQLGNRATVLFVSNDIVQVPNGAVSSAVDDSAETTTVNLTDSSGEMKRVISVDSGGGTLDLSDATVGAVVVAGSDDEDDLDIKTIVLGSNNNDTYVVGANVQLSTGGGTNEVILNNSDDGGATLDQTVETTRRSVNTIQNYDPLKNTIMITADAFENMRAWFSSDSLSTSSGNVMNTFDRSDDELTALMDVDMDEIITPKNDGGLTALATDDKSTAFGTTDTAINSVDKTKQTHFFKKRS